MLPELPQKLLDCESQVLISIRNALHDKQLNRISININFEGLRLLPIAIRLIKEFSKNNKNFILIWPDAGATALAKRDAPEYSENIFSFKEILETEYINNNEFILFAISPQHYDYEIFENVSKQHKGIILMLNGKLEESAVGIGSVARERRKLFLSNWVNIYWLEPIKNGAMIHLYPSDWILYKLSSNKYSVLETFKLKPSPDQIFESFLSTQ